MTIKVISRYTRGKAKQPMAMVVIIVIDRTGRKHSHTRHCVVCKDGSLMGYWPGNKIITFGKIA